MIAALAVATLLQAAAPGTGITRTVLLTTPTLEAARVTYEPGAVEPPGNHGYDVVLVPLDTGMSADVDGEPAPWEPYVPVLVSRGAPHRIENRSGGVVRFIEVRTVGDAPAGDDRVVAANDAATIVRSTYGKYVRATVWRFQPGGHVEWPADAVDAIEIVDIPRGSRTGSSPLPGMVPVPPDRARIVTPTANVVSLRSLTDDAVVDLDVVRISRMASR